MTPDRAQEEVADRIRRLRAERGLSQSQVAGPGVSKSYLSLIESGQRRATDAALVALAQRLGTSVDYLATGRERSDLAERITFAELALHNGAHTEALDGFTSALDELTGRGEGGDLADRASGGQARALELVGRYDEAARAYDALWRGYPAGSTRWAQAAIDLVRCYNRANDVAYAIEVGEAALATFERLDLEWSDEAVRLGVTLAGTYTGRGDLLRAETLLVRLIGIAERMGSPLARGSAYWNAAINAGARGERDTAMRFAERALALIGETDHQRNISRLRVTYANLLAQRPDRLTESLAVLEEARSLLVDHGDTADLVLCVNTQAQVALSLGWTHQARSYVDEALLLPPTDSAPDRAVTQVMLARVLLAEGDVAGATRATEAASAAIATTNRSRDAVEVWQLIADVWEHMGETTRALAAYRTALEAGGQRIATTVTMRHSSADESSGSARR